MYAYSRTVIRRFDKFGERVDVLQLEPLNVRIRACHMSVRLGLECDSVDT